MTNNVETEKDLVFVPAQFRDDVTVKLMDMMGDEQSIVRRARVSVKGSNSQENVPGTPLDLRDVGLLKRLYKDEHGVPFEGVDFEFYMEAPLFTIQQLIKHRHSSINQSSGRYSEMNGTFYLPSKDRPLVQVGKTMDYNFSPAEDWQYEANSQMIRTTCETWWHNYNSLLHIGISKEAARFTTPHNLYASLYYKSNLRSILNFLKLRSTWENAKIVKKTKAEKKEIASSLIESLLELVEEDFDKELASERVESMVGFILGGPRVQSHPQYEIEQIADKIAKVVEERLPNVWYSFVRAGYYSV